MAPYMNPTILGVIGPGFLNQVPTLCRYLDPKVKYEIQLMYSHTGIEELLWAFSMLLISVGWPAKTANTVH